MLIASVKSNKIIWVNNLNDIPYLSSLIIACSAMLPTFVFQSFLEVIFGPISAFEFSFTYFLNTLSIHVFILILFDIRIRIFFIPSILFCLIGMAINFRSEYDQIIALL